MNVVVGNRERAMMLVPIQLIDTSLWCSGLAVSFERLCRE